ncbi:MAG: hypothetical protein MZV70_12400 [Desulfobacterales bacterium]|nr:hypothetical protein [Desulfobacterales bacterium]
MAVKNVDLTMRFDWRSLNSLNWISPVKDQAICGPAGPSPPSGRWNRFTMWSRALWSTSTCPSRTSSPLVTAEGIAEGCRHRYPRSSISSDT